MYVLVRHFYIYTSIHFYIFTFLYFSFFLFLFVHTMSSPAEESEDEDEMLSDVKRQKLYRRGTASGLPGGASSSGGASAAVPGGASSAGSGGPSQPLYMIHYTAGIAIKFHSQ